MDTLNIKKITIIILVIYSFSRVHASLPQIGDKQTQIIFKIIDYKKQYRRTDKIILSIENISNIPLWFAIGEEAQYQDQWLQFNPDINNPEPLKEVAVTYNLLKPHQLKIIAVSIKKINITPQKKHGASRPLRFFLKFGTAPNRSQGEIATDIYTIKH